VAISTPLASGVDYWMGAGAWAGMPDTRRRTIATAMN
jgi:hypothetical protein